MRSFFAFLFCFLYITISSQDEVSVQRFSQIPDNSSVKDILVVDSLIYVATSNGLYQINGNSQESILLRKNPCDAISLGSRDNIWASFENRYLENITTEAKTNYNNQSIEVHDIEQYKGRIWIASNQGILTVNTRTNELTNPKTDRNSDLPSNKVSFLYVDDQDQMWIGTDKGIVLVNKKEKWKTYEKKLSMEAMHYNHEGLWLVSNKEMWVVDPYNRWYPAAIERGLKKGEIRDITADSTGRLYMASEILVRYDPYNEKIESFAETPGLISKLCTTVESDKDNRIWLGTANSGLFIIGFEDQAIHTDLSAICIVEKNIQCVGEKAKVNLKILGGSRPYSVQWSDGVNADLKRNLGAGKYSVKIRDATGTVAETSVEIQEIQGIQLSLLESTQESRFGAKDARASVLVSGGTAPYNIKWENGERGTKAMQLENGLQEIVVTDGNNCQYLANIEIKADRILPNLQIAKIKVGQTLQINNLFFQADSTGIISESFPVLDEIHEFLTTHESVVIEIGGHTNNIPSHEYCDKLSTARAKSVAYYLFNKGISDERISYKGYGKRNPIASNRSLTGRKKNQRVEIKIIQIAG